MIKFKLKFKKSDALQLGPYLEVNHREFTKDDRRNIWINIDDMNENTWDYIYLWGLTPQMVPMRKDRDE